MAAMTERFEMRLDEETLNRVDEWRRQQSDIPSRAEAIRRLLEAGLAKGGGKTVTFTDGEKLILLMLKDLYRGLDLENPEIDADLIAEMIYGGHYWAHRYALSGVFHGHEDDPRELSYVIDVLDMWTFIERGYEHLSKPDKAKVKKDADLAGEKPTFLGFDGNNEGEQMSIAFFLVNKLERFTRFKGRDLNSHMPTRDWYSRMLLAFGPMRNDLRTDDLSAAQLATLLRR